MSSHDKPAVIGVWDGHDAGAALIVDGRVVLALNEERLSARKLDVGLPVRAIAALRVEAGKRPIVWAPTTSDFSKTLTRFIPSLKENYYRVRRRLASPGPLVGLKLAAKYRLTQLPSSSLLRRINARYFSRVLNVDSASVYLVDHHAAHAASAAFWPDWCEDAVIVTLDGIGDGASGSVWRWHDKEARLQLLSANPGAASLGLFFEHVTNELQMRPLEDEGKVMALATYAAEISQCDNVFADWFTLEEKSGCMPSLHCRVRPEKMAKAVRDIIWRTPREQVCRMAQQTMEQVVPAFFSSWARHTGLSAFGYAGGVASNIKVNRLVRTTPGINRLRVCPAMGDGGLALGAALWTWREITGLRPRPFADFRLGTPRPDLGAGAEKIATETGAHLARPDDLPRAVARLIADGEVVMWAQGRMELGARALGARSIIARADSVTARDDLNLRLKRRVWFQPFCPSILHSEAQALLADYRGPDDINVHMTMGFLTTETGRAVLAGAVGPDGSCRPQMVMPSSDDPWYFLLLAVKELTGHGAIINTSLNMHGKPMADDAPGIVAAWRESGVKHLALGTALLSKTDIISKP